ncbi:MAG: membrane protein insertase YidC [Burkholderiales bacterium]|nr:membrane protein insertase YidC [Burkholderiales bacterium]
MDSRRLIVFIVLSIGLLFIWDKITPQKPLVNTVDTTINNGNINQVNDSSFKLGTSKMITVTTDVVQAQISELGGDLRGLNLLQHGELKDSKQSYALLTQNNNRIYVAQTGLVDNGEIHLPTHNTMFSVAQDNYVMKPAEKELVVILKANESDGVGVIKTYTFKRNSYIVDVAYQIINNTNKPLDGISAYWRLLRDDAAPEGQSKFVHTFTGASYYSTENKFNKLSFSDIKKPNLTYPENINNGWVGYIQHYFISTWLLNSYGYNAVCTNGVQCRLNFKIVGNDLASAGLLTDLPLIKPHSSYSIAVPLFVGPEEYNVLLNAAPELERAKDYGWVYIFATPLFWLLVKLFGFIKNWGWSIIALTFTVKLVLYPLTRASYISMAKMKALAPKIQKLKEQCGDDKVKMQRSMMDLYRSEKVNPIGGCLPMILQIPVFIGLYWALLSSVELRQASFLWIKDLSLADPYYVLPGLLAITMFLQTFMSPPPADPLQAKMMRIMPVAFSVMFFFFPAGLVVYWLANNILSIAQQWYVNNHVTLRHKNRLNKKNNK